MERAGVSEGFPEGPLPCVTFPDTVIRSEGGCAPAVKETIKKGNGHFLDKAPQTWNGVAIKGLYFMLGSGHPRHQFLEPFNALKGLPIPCQR